MPELPAFANIIIPEEIQPDNLSISYVAGIKDSRYSNYTEFLQKYLNTDQEFKYLFTYPQFDYNEDVTLERTTQWF